MESSNREPANDSGIDPYPRSIPLSLHQALRAATTATHVRLHLHPGFAAIEGGTISLADYRALLVRLYGFHAEFEAAVGSGADRSAWLREDLAALAVGGQILAALPRCTMLPGFDSPQRRLGALYVVEGSTLGGRHLARQLDALLGPAASAGRRFFLGRGADTGPAWQAFLSQLTLSTITPSDRREIVAAAMATFDLFEEWLNGWRTFTA